MNVKKKISSIYSRKTSISQFELTGILSYQGKIS